VRVFLSFNSKDKAFAEAICAGLSTIAPDTVLPSEETNRGSHAISSSCSAQSAVQRDLRSADLETGAIHRVELPRRQDDHDTWCHLNVNDLTRCTPPAPNTMHTSAVERMPAIVDDDILPDMGRMVARLLWAENHGYSPARIGVVSVPGHADPDSNLQIEQR
jgi:hypothetical protein